jgi:hypothetical protein
LDIIISDEMGLSVAYKVVSFFIKKQMFVFKICILLHLLSITDIVLATLCYMVGRSCGPIPKL